MQNDTKLPKEQRRNYKNCFEALYRITKTEGFSRLYVGFHMATLRGIYLKFKPKRSINSFCLVSLPFESL